MADRVNRKMINHLFALFCRANGFRLAERHNDEDGFAIDYYPIGGGYQVVQLGKNGGVSQPFGSRRYKPALFADILRFSIDVAQHIENTKERRRPGAPASQYLARNPSPRRRRRVRKNPGGFMQEFIYQGDGWIAETSDGSIVIYDWNAPDVDDLRKHIGKKIHLGDIYGVLESVEHVKGWFGRYSAPGYLDATPWEYAKTRKELESTLRDLYGDLEDEDEE